VLVFGALVIATLTAYFYFRVGTNATVFDGFGRQVYEAPFMLRLVEVNHWRGLGWFLLDMVVFWSALGLGMALVAFGFGRR